MRLKTFTCVGFEGMYPAGTAAVIIAENKKEAKVLLEEELTRLGMGQSVPEDEIFELKREKQAEILCNGDY